MYLALRLLTLIAFTAHAVLGCCLSHGSCMRIHVATQNSDVCSHHDHECDSHEAEVDHHDQGQSTGSILGSWMCLDFCPEGDHDPSKHCDDAQCVFGVVGSPTTLSDLQFVADAIWIDASVDFWQLASRRTAFVVDGLEGPPGAPHHRAVFQVWII